MKKKGLIIDDHVVVCKVIEKLLWQHGIEPVRAVDSNQAQTLLREIAQDLALIVMDLIIPGGLSGWDMITEIKQSPKFAHIPVIIITGLSLSAVERDKLSKISYAFVSKQDFDLQTFNNILDNLLASENHAERPALYAKS